MTERGDTGPADARTGLPFVTVVVPARDEASAIGRAVESLLRQAYPAERFEIVVADGRSSDGTADVVRALADRDSRVRLVENPSRITPAGMNAGIRAARGDVIALMSAHGAAEPDHLRRGVDDLATTGAWCVGGAIVRESRGAAARAIALVTASPIGVGDATHNYATTAGWVDTAFPGMWPRRVFETVGLFDEELVRNQDDELSLRIREAGGGIWYDPAIRVRYQARATLRRLFSQYRQYGFWKVRVLQKHPAGLRARHFVPAGWVAWLLAGGAFAAFAPAARPVWILGVGAYGVAVGGGTFRLREPGVGWLRLAWTAAVLHAAYGIGSLQGAIALLPRWVVDRRGTVELLAPRAEPDGVIAIS